MQGSQLGEEYFATMHRDPGGTLLPLIRPYRESDRAAIRSLFIRVNRELAPANLRGAFVAYIERSLADEIDRIPDYYAERGGAFFVAEEDAALAGMFGLERAGPNSCELRRMYVEPALRRRGVARKMLAEAEAAAWRMGCAMMVLSTSELQQAALALYRNAGYRLVGEEIASKLSHKTVGGGLRRFWFEKRL